MAVVVAVCALALVGGYLFKAQCLQPWDGRQYERLCYNDIQALYGVRGVQERIFPYVDGRLEGEELVQGAIEYPVLTGVFMWATGAFADDGNDYLKASAVFLAPFGLLAAYLLARMTKQRALMWAAAPAIVLYSFHNWDLLVVAAAVLGFWLWHKGNSVGAAVAFGVGACLKLYPIFFVGPLVLEALMQRDLRRAAQIGAAGVGTLVLVNLPFALVNPTGWWATFEFHRQRTANYDSIWQFGWPELSPSTLNVLSGALTLAFFGGILAWGIVRSSKEQDRYPVLATSAALLATFLLWNKVHSPQYTLWLLPFFVLLRVNIGWWIAYAVADLLVYVGVFRWFFDLLFRNEDFTLAKRALIAGVWGRAALLAVLIWVFMRAREHLGVSPATVEAPVSHPMPNLEGVGGQIPAGS